VARQDNFSVTASVDGDPLGVFDTFSGGETDSDDTKHRAGAMGPEEALGGPPSVGNITISRLFKTGRDVPIAPKLRPKVGRGTAVITKQLLDKDGNAFGAPEVFRGILKRVQSPEHDSNSSDGAMLELEFVLDEVVA
jgi:hypothetical protein